MRLQDLLKAPQALPVVPEVAAQLIATFEDDDVGLSDIADIVEREPVLVAKVLRQANSAYFRLLRPVGTVRDALMILGLNKVRALAIGSVVNDSFHAVGGMNLDHFWHYSLATSQVARFICEPLSMDENIAFTTGLLHGIGELVMHAGMPEVMARVDRSLPLLALARAERQYEILGYSYAEVGAALAREWRLPKAMGDAIGAHTRPLDQAEPQPLAAVVHLAAWRARVRGSGDDIEHLIHTYPDEVGVLLGIDPDRLVTKDLAVFDGVPDF